MNLHDKLYYVKKNINTFSRKKLTMTDSKGNVWHRYDKAAITYEIYCHTIVGKITTIVEGNVPEEYTAENENAYYTSLGNLVYESEIDCFGSLNWFTSQEAAANFIDNCRAKYE